MVSLSQELDKHRGVGPGFDFLRIGLAVSIVAMHCFFLTRNSWIRQSPFWYSEYALVPMFFALSGFLISGSAMRLSLKNFLINRSLRIIPALCVDIVICALIIGPIVTTSSLGAYFSDRRFFEYFLNSFGWIHYRLPGVFETHDSSQVNGSLWTIPYEIFCYAIMSFLMATGGIKRPVFVAFVTISLFGAGLLVEQMSPGPHHHLTGLLGANHPQLLDVLKTLFVRRGATLLLAFLMGIFAYQLREKIPYSWTLFGLCCLISLIGVFAMHNPDLERVSNRIIFVPPLVYMTVFLGITRIPIPNFLHRGDYSYGVYLYHDPFLQIIIGLVPITMGTKLLGPSVLFALGLPVTFIIAFGSWHFVEKPILSLRKKFSFVAKIRGVEADPDAAVPQPTPSQAFAKSAAPDRLTALKAVHVPPAP